mgnify:CR=1 FL=1
MRSDINMNQKEREILKLEESFRDTIENDILNQNTENKKRDRFMRSLF